MTDEEHRILRAARDRRIYTNDHGRWLIAGEKRPERNARERMLRLQYIDWTWDDTPGGRVAYRITSEGEAALRLAEVLY
jgi:hypothetical protein